MQDKKYTIYDSHAHIFPDKIARKATDNIGHFYDIPMTHCATSEQLVEFGSEAGITKMLVCSTATTPRQVTSINDFIYSECLKHPEFFGFGTLHPFMDDYESEIIRISEMGLHGIKLHPDFQLFDIDDEKAIDMYKLVAKYDLPILFHIGDDRYTYSEPQRLITAMNEVEDLVCIAAHFGGYRHWHTINNYDISDRLYFDTSSSLFMLDHNIAVDAIRHFGADRFMFGTDFPMWNPKKEVEDFLSLPLTEEERKQIFSKTFDSLFM
ncbi:MAG: radical SAM protein [Anaerofustis stercorihominis]|nr:radical SAM protein [Anaerofustis stercorihominis]